MIDRFIEIYRTYDVDLVREILTEPSIYSAFTDDLSVPVDEFDPSPALSSEKVFFLVPYVDGKPSGVGIFHPINGVTYGCHFNILPEYRGSTAINSAKKAIEWMFSNTECLKLTAYAPLTAPWVADFLDRIGAVVEGSLTKSFLKKGVLHDQAIYGLCKDDY